MYKSLVSKTIIILLSFLIILALSLPILLKSLGLHPDFDSKTFQLNGRKALIIASSHNVLNLPGEVRGKDLDLGVRNSKGQNNAIRGHEDRSRFIIKETINVYPDTLCWIHDKTRSILMTS